MKEFFIADAARFEGQSLTTYFLVTAIAARDRKGSGQYLALTLADKSGQFDARMWEDFDGLVESCPPGTYVKVQGTVSKYQGKSQITLTRMRAAEPAEIDTADFVPTTEFDVAAMDTELRTYVAAFRSADLRRLVLAFLDDPQLGPAFIVAPAAKRLHHAWLGGLLEHVLCLVRVCLATAPFYPEVDPDLLVAGAILHDFGKVRELSWGSTFDYTLEGQLIGHISIVQGLLHEKVAQLDAAAQLEGGQPFPQPLRILIEHMLLSHHGKYEFGSPKLPMTPEAMLLSALDDLEAKFQTLRNEFAAARTAGRSPAAMTDWVRSMDRALFNSRAWLEAELPASDSPDHAAADVEASAASPEEPEDNATRGLFS
jgi:3'-5' exoribonuclease